MQLYTQLYSSK